jgi:membrane-associated phospholipid phosphatase
MALLIAAVIYPFDSYTAFTVLESFSVTAAITGAIKYLIGRARPYQNVGPYHLTFLSTNYDFQSFPSGHSALVWSIFTPVAERFGDYWYIVPAVFSAQRLWADQHWLSDVVYGGLIGWSVGSTFETNRNGE